MADVLPFNAPSRRELWRRVRLAEAILNQRVLAPTATADPKVTAGLLLRVLRGEDTAGPESEEVS